MQQDGSAQRKVPSHGHTHVICRLRKPRASPEAPGLSAQVCFSDPRQLEVTDSEED